MLTRKHYHRAVHNEWADEDKPPRAWLKWLARGVAGLIVARRAWEYWHG